MPKSRMLVNQKTILKQLTNELPELLLYLFFNTQGVNKVASYLEIIKPEKKKKKPNTIPPKTKLNAKDEVKVEDKRPSVEQANKPLDLALIDGALFMHLVKSRKQKAKITAISMQDIEYQLNKVTKPLTDLKTVVPATYHDFLNVFSKKNL